MVNDPECLTLTVPEAAKVLGITAETAYVWAREGDIPALKIRGRWLVKRLELERMLGSTETATFSPTFIPPYPKAKKA